MLGSYACPAIRKGKDLTFLSDQILAPIKESNGLIDQISPLSPFCKESIMTTFTISITTFTITITF
jgi:hypothetical protein